MLEGRVARLHHVERHTGQVERRLEPERGVAPEAVGDGNVPGLVEARAAQGGVAAAAVDGPYFATRSTSSGKTWSTAIPLRDSSGNYIGCARPHMVQLGNVTLLAGGRMMMGHDYSRSFSVWMCTAKTFPLAPAY